MMRNMISGDISQANMMLFDPKNKQAKIGLMDLSVEILMEIFKRLPVISVYRLRSVSKTLLDLVDSPLFVSLHSLTQIATNAVAEEPHQLMFRYVVGSPHCWDTGRDLLALQSTYYDLGKGKITGAEIMSMAIRNGCLIRFVFNNWFCFKMLGDERCFLIDPCREEVLRLPTCDIMMKKYTSTKDQFGVWSFCGMGFDKITSTYKFVRVYQISCRKGERSRLVAVVHVLGTSSWYEVPAPAFAPNSLENSYCFESISAYGDAHWMFDVITKPYMNHIISFDFTKEEFYSTPHPAALSTQMFLRFITLKGSMAIVKIFQTTTIDIWVMKDYNTKEWTLEYNIDVQTLGLNLSRAPCAEWENGLVIISGTTSFFFDLRQVPVNHVTCQVEGYKNCLKILCLKRSLISLKEFGNLVEGPFE